MQPFPHHYRVAAVGGSDSNEPVQLQGEGLPALASAMPLEFDGPGDRWSPETLLLAAMADCFVLTFRALAQASKFTWSSLECVSEGTLDRVDGVTRFTAITNRVTLEIPTEASEDQARRLLSKTESVCLISHSLTARVRVEVDLRKR